MNLCVRSSIAVFGALGIAISTGIAGNILSGFAEFVACKFARVSTCNLPSHFEWQLGLVGLCLAMGAICIVFAFWASKVLLQGVTVRAEGAQITDLKCDTLILPVSKPFSDRDNDAAQYDRESHGRLREIILFLQSPSSENYEFKIGDKRIRNWTLEDLCNPGAEFSGPTGKIKFEFFSWQQAWRSLQGMPGYGVTSIIVLADSGGTSQFSNDFKTILALIIERDGVPGVTVQAPQVTNFQELKELNSFLRQLTEREVAPPRAARVRIDITGGTRIFAIAAAIESTRNDQIIFSYVPPGARSPKAYDIEVVKWDFK